MGLPAQVTLGGLLNHCRTEQTAVSRAQSDAQRGRRGIAGTGYRLSASSITAGRNRQPLAGHSQTHREADVGLPGYTAVLFRLLQ